MTNSPRILLSWAVPPHYMPPFRLNSDQITTCVYLDTNSSEDQQNYLWTPVGHYDLSALLQQHNCSLNFDLVIVYAEENNLPLNLAQFDCPKLLIIADTHHKPHTLEVISQYLEQETFDFIASTYTLQHLHWFWEIKKAQYGWLPGLSHHYHPFQTVFNKEYQCAFVGKFYPHRRLLIDLINEQGYEIIAGKANRQMMTKIYQSALISLNISCNGDLNLRIFEILAAGGCLLTDYLTPQSGLYSLLEQDTEFLTFKSAQELLAKIEYLIQHPKIAQNIARQGYKKYLRHYHPDILKQRLLDWVFKGEQSEPFTPNSDPRFQYYQSFSQKNLRPSRLKFYQYCQMLNQQEPNFHILFLPDIHPVYIIDISDLPHFKITLIAPSTEQLEAFKQAHILSQLTILTLEEALNSSWSMVVHNESEHKLPFQTKEVYLLE